MNTLTHFLVTTLFMGLGATLTFDLWGLLLKRAFGIAPANICLVGRWVRYMPQGTFTHVNIASASSKRAECVVGWVAHYTIGILFAIAFVALAGHNWLQRPTPLPALIFGAITVLAPFFIMQPAFGFGIVASRSPNPVQARVRSLMNHLAFGTGLYLFAILVNWFLPS